MSSHGHERELLGARAGVDREHVLAIAPNHRPEPERPLCRRDNYYLLAANQIIIFEMTRCVAGVTSRFG